MTYQTLIKSKKHIEKILANHSVLTDVKAGEDPKKLTEQAKQKVLANLRIQLVKIERNLKNYDADGNYLNK